MCLGRSPVDVEEVRTAQVNDDGQEGKTKRENKSVGSVVSQQRMMSKDRDAGDGVGREWL
jgi:hypothetical protein